MVISLVGQYQLEPFEKKKKAKEKIWRRAILYFVLLNKGFACYQNLSNFN